MSKQNSLLSLFLFCQLSCIPRFQKNTRSPTFGTLPNKNLQDPQLSPISQRQEISQKEDQYFFPVSQDTLWNALLDVLLGSYNLTIVDDKNAVITTDWDTYFEGENLLRNKLSLRIGRAGFRSSVMTLINNQQQLTNTGELGLSSVGTIWTPRVKEDRENKRIIKHLAEHLALTPPAFAYKERDQDKKELH